jgi:hypothetical protein
MARATAHAHAALRRAVHETLARAVRASVPPSVLDVLDPQGPPRAGCADSALSFAWSH